MMRWPSLTTPSIVTDLKKAFEKRYMVSSSSLSSGLTPARSRKTRMSFEASTIRSSKRLSTRASSSWTQTRAPVSRVKWPTQPKWSMWAWVMTTWRTSSSETRSPKRSRISSKRWRSPLTDSSVPEPTSTRVSVSPSTIR